MTPASNEMGDTGRRVMRYRLSYRHGVIEDDGSPRACDDSKPMVLASEYDALVAALNSADQKLSGIQQYAACKTAREEAALIRADIRAALKQVKP